MSLDYHPLRTDFVRAGVRTRILANTRNESAGSVGSGKISIRSKIAKPLNKSMAVRIERKIHMINWGKHEIV